MSTINNQLFFSFDQPLAREHFEAEAQKYQKMMVQRVVKIPRELRPQLQLIDKAVSSRFPSRGKKESVLRTVSEMNVINVTEKGVAFTPTGLAALAALGKRRGKNMDLAATKKEAVTQGFDAAFQAYQTAKLEKVVRDAEAQRAAELEAAFLASLKENSPKVEEVKIDILPSDDEDLLGLDEVSDDCDVADIDDDKKTEEKPEEVNNEKPNKSRFAWLKGLGGIFAKLFSFLFGWMSKSSKKEESPVEVSSPEERV